MTTRRKLDEAVQELIDEALTVEAWFDDTAYPKRLRERWDEIIGKIRESASELQAAAAERKAKSCRDLP